MGARMAKRRDWNSLSKAAKERFLAYGRRHGLSPQKIVGHYKSGGDLRPFYGKGGRILPSVAREETPLWVATADMGYIRVRGLNARDRSIVGEHLNLIEQISINYLDPSELEAYRGVYVGGYRWTTWQRAIDGPTEWSKRTSRRYPLMSEWWEVQDWYDRDMPTPHESIYRR